MNISKMNLNGVEYNLTDKDAQSKINSLQENTYTKTEVDNLIDSVDVSDQLADYAKKSEIPAPYDDTDVKDRIAALEGKEDKDTIYDDTAITNRVKALEAIDHSKYLTQHQDISGKADKSYVDGKVADLVNSAPATLDTLGELATAITEHKEVTDALDAAITQKVDKVAGKGLSTNDYTTAEKNKLAATPSFWVGSQAEYDAIAVKDKNTFYYITE